MLHERVGSPSRCTVQAPHWAMPHPNFVPVSLSCSRTDPKQRRIRLCLYADRFAVDRKRDVRHALLHWQSVLARGMSRTLLTTIRTPQAARTDADRVLNGAPHAGARGRISSLGFLVVIFINWIKPPR